ncbi:MAG: TlpA family protein disulfide reductase [Asgard group archaeon]|nr:TlpA family protein disulfide reductase [Asgard group archaeon]
MKTRKIFLFTILTLFISFTFIVLNQTNSVLPFERETFYKTNLLQNGTPAIDFTLKDITSQSMKSFSSFEGKVVVLGFFTSYGEFDTLMMDVYKEILTTYSSSKIAVMMMAMDPATDDEPTVQSIIDSFQINWPVFRDDGTVTPYYEVYASPTVYLITPSQSVYFHHVGPIDLENLGPEIDIIIPDDPPPTGGTIPEFWQKNWIWVMLGGIGTIVLSGLLIYRRRIVVHNKKVRAEKFKRRQQRARKR